jgi:hypothetical protein
MQNPAASGRELQSDNTETKTGLNYPPQMSILESYSGVHIWADPASSGCSLQTSCNHLAFLILLSFHWASEIVCSRFTWYSIWHVIKAQWNGFSF